MLSCGGEPCLNYLKNNKLCYIPWNVLPRVLIKHIYVYIYMYMFIYIHIHSQYICFYRIASHM